MMILYTGFIIDGHELTFMMHCGHNTYKDMFCVLCHRNKGVNRSKRE